MSKGIDRTISINGSGLLIAGLFVLCRGHGGTEIDVAYKPIQQFSFSLIVKFSAVATAEESFLCLWESLVAGSFRAVSSLVKAGIPLLHQTRQFHRNSR